MESKTEYVPPTVVTLEAEDVLASLGPASASGSHHGYHGRHGRRGGGHHYGGWWD